jgi:RNA polymerase sigma factor (sigma-70 family)
MGTTPPHTLVDRIEELTATLQNIAWRYSSPEVSADDIYQGIVEKILKSCEPTDTRSFICQCATWHAKNMLMSERIYNKYILPSSEETIEDEESYDIIDLAVSTEPDPEEWILRKERVASINEIILNAQEKNRNILVSLSQGETHQEIADRLKVSRSAVTNRVRDLRGAFCVAGLI